MHELEQTKLKPDLGPFTPTGQRINCSTGTGLLICLYVRLGVGKLKKFTMNIDETWLADRQCFSIEVFNFWTP